MTDGSPTQDVLPTPGLLGILVRLAVGIAVFLMGYGALVDAASFWDGFGDPVGSLGYVVPLAIFSSWVSRELVQRPWGWRPTFALLAGLAVAMAVGAMQGDPFGPVYGIYLWVWTLAFSLLLAPAQVLAAILRTPGCEMRSYAHLWTKVRGGDPKTVVCPGWIDRFDAVRLLGRF